MKMGFKNYKLVHLDTNALSEFVNNKPLKSQCL